LSLLQIKSLIHQLLLLAKDLPQFFHLLFNRALFAILLLLLLAVGLQIIHHVLQILQHLLCLFAITRSRHIFDLIEQLMEQMEQEGLEPTEGLGEAGEAMGQAEGELGEGDTGEAGNQQGRALQALREGAQQMLNQLQQQMQAQGQGQGQGQGNQQGQQGQQGQGNQRDPLGRRQGGEREGLYGRSDNGNFDDADNVQRAREILEIIRRRLGENFRLEFEKEYLERLLKPTE
jgi:hypothetical protein